MKSLLASVRCDVKVASERNLSKLVELIREIPN
jgi:hypothetical protein